MSGILKTCPICKNRFINLWKHFWELHPNELSDSEFLAKYLNLNEVPKCNRPECNNECQVIYKYYKFSNYCSRSCISKLNKLKLIEYQNLHPSKRKLAILDSELNPRYCKDCGVKLKYTCLKGYCINCTPKHREFDDDARYRLHLAGIKSSQLQCESKRSKAEILFCKLCESKFKNVKHNIAMFNGWDADVIIEDLKVAVLWNGAWHYKKITRYHSVKQVQNRDRLKIKEIINSGYKPYVIKDEGKFNKDKVYFEFNKFLKEFNIAG